jgi:hypothetical protein
MTLGGLALAVGILVDEATVTIENIHTHLARGSSLARAALAATSETALPRFLAMLCILAVFIPAFFMTGAARSLFVPLSLAVGFSMAASYLLSSTFVPVLSVWALRPAVAHKHSRETFFDRMRRSYERLARSVIERRRIAVILYLVISTAIVVVTGGALGTEIFPVVDTGQFQLHLRAQAGTRIERTEQIALQALDAIKREVGPGNVEISLGFVGTQPPNYPINTIYLWSSGPEEAVLQIQLKRNAGIRVEDLKERLRRKLPEELPEVRFSFEPSDIVSRVMSFGAPTPIEVAVSGRNLAETRWYAEKLRGTLAQVPTLRDLAFEQELDYPIVAVNVNREHAGVLGVTVDDVAKSVVNRHLVKPLHRSELLGRPQKRRRLSNPGRDSRAADEFARRGEEHPHCSPRPRRAADRSAQRGHYQREHRARGIRPLQHAADADAQREHLGRELGRRGGASRASDQRRGTAAPGGERGRARSTPADAGDVRGVSHGPFGGGGRHITVACRQFPVVSTRRGGGTDHSGGRCRRRHGAVAHTNHSEHSILHGRDHGNWRGGGECDFARHFRRTELGGRPLALRSRTRRCA